MEALLFKFTVKGLNVKFFQQLWLRKIVMVSLLIVANALVPAVEEAESLNMVQVEVDVSTESVSNSAAQYNCCAGDFGSTSGESSYSCDNCQHCQSGHSDYQVASTHKPIEFSHSYVEFNYALVSLTPSRLLRPPIS